MKLRIYRILAILFFYPVICGFTFDEDILTACEQKHPVDFIARVVCNNNLEKKNNQAKCEASQQKNLEKKLLELAAYLDIRHPIALSDLQTELNNQFDLKSQLINSSQDENKKVIFFSIKPKCDTGFTLTGNIHHDENKKTSSMLIWRKPVVESQSSTIYGYEWNPGSTSEYRSHCEFTSYGKDSCRKLKIIETKKIEYLVQIIAQKAFSEKKSDEPKAGLIASKLQVYITLQSDAYKTQDAKLNQYDITIPVVSSKLSLPAYEINLQKDGETLRGITLRQGDQTIFHLAKRENPPTPSKQPASDFSLIDFAIWSLFLLGLVLTAVVLYVRYFSRGKSKFQVFFRNFFSQIKASNPGSGPSFHGDSSSPVDFKDKNTGKYSASFIDHDPEFENFIAKNPFVSVFVEPELRTEFIEECKWMEKKIGFFPPESEQQKILESIRRGRE